MMQTPRIPKRPKRVPYLSYSGHHAPEEFLTYLPLLRHSDRIEITALRIVREWWPEGWIELENAWRTLSRCKCGWNECGGTRNHDCPVTDHFDGDFDDE